MHCWNAASALQEHSNDQKTLFYLQMYHVGI